MGIAVVCLFAVFLLLGLSRWAHIVTTRQHDLAPYATATTVVRPDEQPDVPRPFGPDSAWFSVPSRDVQQVARVLGLRTAMPANWATGLAGAATGLFVGVRGEFVCAVGRDAWRDQVFADIAAALERLSRVAGRACWFGIDADGERFGWALARAGALQRAFCWDGTADAIVWDDGACTVAEAELGFFVDDPRDGSDDPIKWWPTVGDVLALAARWSIDPRRVASGEAAATGLLGRW